MGTDILKNIQTLMPDLSKSQRSIAVFILDHYDKAAYMTASKLGETVGVSESTVVRFATMLGFEGYPELQRSLRELIRTRLTSIQRIEIANDRIRDGEILEKVIASDSEKLKNTLENINHKNFENAVERITKAKRIYIAGMRSSSSLASFMHYYFNLLFDDVRLIHSTSTTEILEQILRIDKDDVMIAISFPRYSKQLIKAVDFAKAQNSYIIALTDSETSPIALYADSTLIAKSDMASFVDSLVAPLSIINALIVAISRKKHGEVEGIFKKLEKIWDEYEVYDKASEI